ncbi:hypothetical protein [Streptomyces sp. WAC07061]|uniref:hypothetical protein n=1 Tax=Streptomyces sp. WAC07061 TaxID=2487410 RepID=UPI00163C8098|nr:hypothetical protein [Streptomyces sp. WAC07061]
MADDPHSFRERDGVLVGILVVPPVRQGEAAARAAGTGAEGVLAGISLVVDEITIARSVLLMMAREGPRELVSEVSRRLAAIRPWRTPGAVAAEAGAALSVKTQDSTMCATLSHSLTSVVQLFSGCPPSSWGVYSGGSPGRSW